MPRQKFGLRKRITENTIRDTKIDVSFGQEKRLMNAIRRVINDLLCKEQDFKGITLGHESKIYLNTVISQLCNVFNDTEFTTCFETSYMKPDGGILYIIDKKDNTYPILICEKKNQGTNDLRKLEGLQKQARGNAIERLGKNVIGLKAYSMQYNIFPFICFGDGCDFAEDSSIIDRVKTIAMFGELNKEYIFPTSNNCFLRGAFYFRVNEWTENEMYSICYRVATRSIYHYFSLFGKEAFI